MFDRSLVAAARHRIVGVVGAALTVGALSACGGDQGAKMLQVSGSTMGTTYRVKIVDKPAAMGADTLESAVADILEQVNGRMSTYRSDSELSRLNHNPSTDWIDVSKQLLDVVEAGARVSRLSAGAFDVTVGPLVALWGFGSQQETHDPPAHRDIAKVLSRIGYRKISLRRTPPGIRKARKDVYVDLSAIAKGYAVDRIAAHLEAQGADNYLVEIGGDLRVKGRNREGRPWLIAIEKPTDSGRVIQRAIRTTGHAIATSGDYRNFFEKDGKRYSHTIDPASGMPVSHRLASVTVLSPEAMSADALATALMVLGPEDGYSLAQRLGITAHFITRDEQGFSEKSTSEFARLFALDVATADGDLRN